MLNEDYKEMLQLLIEEKVEFMLVGAYALGVHGVPRATGDIDIWIKPNIENSEKVYKVLQKFGTPIEESSKSEFAREGIIFQIGVAPRRIDLMTQIDGVEFEDAYKEKIIVDIDRLQIPVISLDKLIKNKISTGREKDKLDVSLLQKKNT